MSIEQWPAAQALYSASDHRLAPPSRDAQSGARIGLCPRSDAMTKTQLPQGKPLYGKSCPTVGRWQSKQAKNLGDQPATSCLVISVSCTNKTQRSDATSHPASFVQAQAIDAEDIAYQAGSGSDAYLELREISRSDRSYTEAVNNLKSLRSDLVAINPDVQFSFRDEVEPVYRQLVDLKSEKGSKASHPPASP